MSCATVATRAASASGIFSGAPSDERHWEQWWLLKQSRIERHRDLARVPLSSLDWDGCVGISVYVCDEGQNALALQRYQGCGCHNRHQNQRDVIAQREDRCTIMVYRRCLHINPAIRVGFFAAGTDQCFRVINMV